MLADTKEVALFLMSLQGNNQVTVAIVRSFVRLLQFFFSASFLFV